MSENSQHCFIFGFGYSASALAQELMAKGWKVSGTSRHKPKRKEMQRLGIDAYDFPDNNIPQALSSANAILTTIAPGKQGDFVLKFYRQAIEHSQFDWIGYCSTTGVYGDHQGKWVDEATPPNPPNERNKLRIAAENAWLKMYHQQGHPVHIFRLAGIYGPGRGVVSKLKQGRMKQRIYKPNQVFSRIHVRDIARAMQASIAQPQAGEIYNVSDDQPDAPQIVAEYAANALGVAVPPLVPIEEAELSAMAQDFYQSNRRVSNAKIKTLLPQGQWCYPTYKQGIDADIAAIDL